MGANRADNGRRPLVWLGMAAAVLAVAIIVALPAGNRQQLPASILGAWYSEEPRYQSCFVDISRDYLVIGGADGNTYLYEIKTVHSKSSATKAGRFFTLVCEDDKGMELDFRLYHEAETGRLSYKNQRQVIWLKAKR